MATGRATSEQVHEDIERKRETEPHNVAAFHMHGFELALEDALEKTRQEHASTEPMNVEVVFTATMKPTKNPSQIQDYIADVRPI